MTTLNEAVAEMTPAKLRAWLIAVADQGYWFRPCEAQLCVLAHYLSRMTNTDVSVTDDDGEHYHAWNNTHIVSLPEWCNRFADAFDRLGHGVVLTDAVIALLESEVPDAT